MSENSGSQYRLVFRESVDMPEILAKEMRARFAT